MMDSIFLERSKNSYRRVNEIKSPKITKFEDNQKIKVVRNFTGSLRDKNEESINKRIELIRRRKISNGCDG